MLARKGWPLFWVQKKVVWVGEWGDIEYFYAIVFGTKYFILKVSLFCKTEYLTQKNKLNFYNIPEIRYFSHFLFLNRSFNKIEENKIFITQFSTQFVAMSTKPLPHANIY